MIIGIVGKGPTGKSTLAQWLQTEYECHILYTVQDLKKHVRQNPNAHVLVVVQGSDKDMKVLHEYGARIVYVVRDRNTVAVIHNEGTFADLYKKGSRLARSWKLPKKHKTR